METKLIRRKFDELSTIGDFYIEDKLSCNMLEDTNRERHGVAVEVWKIPGKTCIPCGRFEIKLTFSNRFGKYLLQLINVPGFAGIRIHKGNVPKDTEGCLLPGIDDPKTNDFMENSGKAYDVIFPIISAALVKKEKVFITIENDKEHEKIY